MQESGGALQAPSGLGLLPVLRARWQRGGESPLEQPQLRRAARRPPNRRKILIRGREHVRCHYYRCSNKAGFGSYFSSNRTTPVHSRNWSAFSKAAIFFR